MELIGKKVLVRAHSAGVYYGTLKAVEGRTELLPLLQQETFGGGREPTQSWSFRSRVQRTGQIADSQFMLKRWSYWMLVKLYLAQMRQSKTLNR